MKAKDLVELSNDDLRVKLNEGRSELFNLRFQMATSQLDNTARIKLVKKDIARVLTEIRQREMALEAAASLSPARTDNLVQDEQTTARRSRSARAKAAVAAELATDTVN